MIEMSTEWLCRDCETDVEKMIKVQEAISPRVSETGHVIPGVPCSIYMKQDVCEKCGVLKFVFEYEKAPEAVKEPLSVWPEIAEKLRERDREAVSEPIKVVLGKTETSVPVAELEVTIEAEVEIEPELEVVAVLDPEVVEEIEEANEKEAEIARLKAQLEALEK